MCAHFTLDPLHSARQFLGYLMSLLDFHATEVILHLIELLLGTCRAFLCLWRVGPIQWVQSYFRRLRTWLDFKLTVKFLPLNPLFLLHLSSCVLSPLPWWYWSSNLGCRGVSGRFVSSPVRPYISSRAWRIISLLGTLPNLFICSYPI